VHFPGRSEAPAPAHPRLPYPNLAQVYRATVVRPHEALQSSPDAREALDAVRRLIERIALTLAPDAKGFEIELVGEIAAMVRLGLTDVRAVSRAGSTRRPRSVRTFGKTGCGDRI
jgi:hypothetical protein